jgi:hypothetical protein
MIRLALLAALLALAPDPAAAGPVAALGGLLFGGAGFTGAISIAAGGFFKTIVGRILVSAAVSLLQSKLIKKPRAPGLRTETTQTGDRLPQTFVLGRTATAGAAVCPPMSHGRDNGYLTYVIDLGDIAGCALDGLIVNDTRVTVDWGGTPHATYGFNVLGKYAGTIWVKFYDGSQTTADSYLTGTYGSYPERPWTSDMVLRGSPHVILTFAYSPKLFQGNPAVLCEVLGIPLYDPRLDSTVGGSGAQRWADRSSWARSLNPAVMIYNIMRGITLASGEVWGGETAAADLPLATWFAAMNDCDTAVPLAAGGSEPRFRAGIEVGVDDEPAEVIEELMKACAAQIAEDGGVWRLRVGGPGLPVAAITDDDLSLTHPQDRLPWPGLDQTFNAVSATYPEPTALWEVRDAPPRTNTTWEAADGGRRLVADLSLPAVPWPDQVQRLMLAYIQDERRFGRHGLALSHRFAAVEALDAIAWTSTDNSYSGKVFEVVERTEDLETFWQQVTLRERDSGDWTWSTAYELPRTLVAPVAVEPDALVPEDWAAAGVTVDDGTGPRRPGLKLSWDPAEVRGVTGLQWEVRLAGGATVLSGTTLDVETGSLRVVAGIVPGTAYEARGRFITDAPADWSAWDAATAPVTLLQSVDLADGSVTDRPVASVAGPFDAPSAWTQRAFLATGPLGHTSAPRRDVHFDARSPSHPTLTLEVVIERRRKINGTWTAWQDIDTVTVNSTGWERYGSTAAFSGGLDDVELRLATTVTGGNYTGTDVLSDIWIVVEHNKK